MDEHLKVTYGFNEFRPYQKEIIQDILDGQNVSAVLPTGGGKSLLYQFPATFTSKITVVVSPLISLMNDQCLALEAKGINSISLNGQTPAAQCSGMSRCTCYLCKILRDELNVSIVYTTPEWLSTRAESLQQISDKICVIAVDEAHCISQWSHDFRPAYKKVSIITKLMPDIPILSVTATATPRVLEDIYDTLSVDDITEYSLGTRRDNMAIRIIDTKDDWIDSVKEDENTIIYTQSKKVAEKLSEELSERNVNAMYYHAGMSPGGRERVHQAFQDGTVKVIVATIAFGMGIDKADIRHVINYGVPTDIETYYQEIGRAGRDGLPCQASLFYTSGDFSTSQFLIRQGAKSEVSRRLENLELFRQYLLDTDACRQQLIDFYFNHGALPTMKSKLDSRKCEICDNCSDTTPGVLVDVTEDIQKMATLIHQNSHGFGMKKTLDLAKGIGDTEYSRILLNSLIKSGVVISHHQEWLNKGRKTYGALYRCPSDKLTRRFTIRLPEKTARLLESKGAKFSKARMKVSQAYGILEQRLMNDRVLKSIREANPTSLEDLWLIDGISSEFITKYGQAYIDALNDVGVNAKSKTKPKAKIGETVKTTMALVQKGHKIPEIAEIRAFKPLTIENHISEWWGSHPDEIDMDYIDLTPEKLEDILRAIKINSGEIEKLTPVMEKTTLSITWLQLKIVLNATKSGFQFPISNPLTTN